MFRIKANGGRDLRQRDLTVTLPFGIFCQKEKFYMKCFFIVAGRVTVNVNHLILKVVTFYSKIIRMCRSKTKFR